jgi:hypothetical protein
MKNRMRVDYEI